MKAIGYFVNSDDAYCPDCLTVGEALTTPITSDTEADSPTHCISCEALIPHGLTPDGLLYVALRVDGHVRDKLQGRITGRACILAKWFEEYGENAFTELWRDELLMLVLHDYFTSVPTVDEHSPQLALDLAAVNGMYPHRWVAIDIGKGEATGPYVNRNAAGAACRTILDEGRLAEAIPIKTLGARQ